ncbi:SDR family oxidoreductase [Pseudarthrobacter sp902506025]|uniref:NAD(P)-dependent dehydrogenase (Short-subunit alcohol dehydrogenase family) n=1 Tax=Pseudarthrobacter defluvii TaxID=410837 RepID=A0ABT9UGF2_9MICC|nr:SDR family oxidoreductase [Pseudarthrobacter defluvii]MDQ0118726.1 NAD(P)-dependent dehydrogenase (short-subunit alcohol dehydrogenase family) [Pseudarthrobacter defluvii]
MCRQAILEFGERGGGIINVTSRSTHRGDDAEHLTYGAAKGGLLALTKGIARGYARENILAYAVAPGWVATDIAGDIATDPALLAGLPLREVTPPGTSPKSSPSWPQASPATPPVPPSTSRAPITCAERRRRSLFQISHQATSPRPDPFPEGFVGGKPWKADY